MSRTGFHPDDKPYELVVFDVRGSGGLERLLSERATWGEGTTVELLGPRHAVLILWVGGAARMEDRSEA